jgi:hypothetical protein
MSFILLGILNSQAAAGGAGAYDLLETQVLASSAASVTFTGLGAYSDYQHLQIRLVGATDAYSGFGLRFNGDTGANYASHRLYGNGGSVGSSASTSSTRIIAVNGLPDETRDTSNIFGAAVIDILDFSNSSKNTTTRNLAGNGVYTDYQLIGLFSGLWNNTNAVTSINLFDPSAGNFVTGSRFSLYGIKGA